MHAVQTFGAVRICPIYASLNGPQNAQNRLTLDDNKEEYSNLTYWGLIILHYNNKRDIFYIYFTTWPNLNKKCSVRNNKKAASTLVFALAKAHLLDTLPSKPNLPPNKTFVEKKILSGFRISVRKRSVGGIVVVLKGCHKHPLLGD